MKWKNIGQIKNKRKGGHFMVHFWRGLKLSGNVQIDKHFAKLYFVAILLSHSVLEYNDFLQKQLNQNTMLTNLKTGHTN